MLNLFPLLMIRTIPEIMRREQRPGYASADSTLQHQYHLSMASILICTNMRPFSHQPSCAQRGSRELADWLEAEISRRQLNIEVERIVCFGQCPKGPNARQPGKAFVHHADKEKLSELLDEMTAT